MTLKEAHNEIRTLMEAAAVLFGKGRVPAPPWEIDGAQATWATAWQVVEIELTRKVGGPEYLQLRAYLLGLIQIPSKAEPELTVD